VGKIRCLSGTATTALEARGFRNVAVGATIKSEGATRTVSAKSSETVLNVNSAWVNDDKPWTYQNPALTLSGIYYLKHTKTDKPKLTPIALKDADSAWAGASSGVYREIQISGWIANATLADREKNITILEGLMDGTQTRDGTCVFAEESPARSLYVYVASATWQIQRDKPKWLDVMINMTECKNRGSLS
jgi:hypothetical protein